MKLYSCLSYKFFNDELFLPKMTFDNTLEKLWNWNMDCLIVSLHQTTIFVNWHLSNKKKLAGKPKIFWQPCFFRSFRFRKKKKPKWKQEKMPSFQPVKKNSFKRILRLKRRPSRSRGPSSFILAIHENGKIWIQPNSGRNMKNIWEV